jgi:hypothetical protein
MFFLLFHKKFNELGHKATTWERRIKMEETNIVVEETTQEMAGASEILTFDEILEDKYYQSEFDKKVAKALETARKKWEKEAEEKRTEAEKLANMNAEEKHKYELEKLAKERDEAISRLNAYELKEQAIKIANEKELPISLLNVIDYTKEDAESIKTKIDEIEVVYKQAIQSGINDRMKEKTPKTVINGSMTDNDDEVEKWREDAGI